LFEFPVLSGEYGVSSHLFHWTDLTRYEQFSSTPSTKREVLAQIWYPSNIHKDTLTQYAPELIPAWKAGLRTAGFPESQLSELDEIRVHATPDAPILKLAKQYPVILFFHGYVAFRSAYTAMCEDLASHGFIVIGVGHTYYSQLTIFPDKRVIAALPEHLRQDKLCDELSSLNEQRIWLDDASFVINQLIKVANDPHSKFYQCMDLQNFGAIGHSFGGSTAIQLARNDLRCKAAVNLDGALFGNSPTVGFAKSIMIVVGQKSWKSFDSKTDHEISTQTGWPIKLVNILREKYKEAIPLLLRNQNAKTYFIEIEGADHGAFSDWVLLKSMPLYRLNRNIFDMEKLTGDVTGSAVISEINKNVASFFKSTLIQE
tara:strand:- start:2318 stop:3433 length:1116 start_codon:yes stop_codon:yes gene_type:complete